MDKERIDCCFCGETLDGLDASYLLAVTRWGRPDDEGVQSLWCHIECLKSRLQSSVPLGVHDG